MQILAQVSIFPVGSGESVSKYVARSLGIVENSGLPYTVGSMGTCIEGEWEDVFKVVKDCFDKMASDNNRVYMVLTCDMRKGREGALTQKIDSLEKKLGHELKK